MDVEEANVAEPAGGRAGLAPRKPHPALLLTLALVCAALVLVLCARAQAATVSSDTTGALTKASPTGSGAVPGQAPPAKGAPPASEESPPVEEAPPVTEETPPVSEETPPAEEVPPVTEETPPVSKETPPAEEVPPVEETPPAEEVPPAEESPPVEETHAVEETPPAEETPPVAEETPPVEQEPHGTEQAAGAVEEGRTAIERETLEQAEDDAPTEAGREAPDSHATPGDSQGSTDLGAPTPPDAAAEVAPEIPITATTSFVPDSTLAISSISEPSSPEASSRTISARCGGRVSCELAAIGASVTGGYAGGWLDILADSSTSTVSFVPVTVAAAMLAARAPAGSEAVSAPTDNRPSAPAPGPAPGGAGGGSAAGGGSGTASSAPFTLVGVQLQAAPSTMRWLHLAQPSWRTAFLVLIPERPD
ncbi:MAG TPA: hypothetical protein VMB51_10475 [Solirubrobacteraceae bacterium]|nr:hypothetical protein [Solirubrobacteraceae bacterium]